MQSKPITKYIVFGTGLRYLQDVKGGWAIHGKDFILDNCDRFFADLKEFDLPVTDRAAGDLKNIRQELSKKGPEDVLTAEEARKLGNIVSDLRKTLLAEAMGKVAFIVSDKRIDVQKLLSNVSGLMAPGIFDLLPDVAKYDLKNAGRCMAFELPTAGAFHVLRATESVLRHYYCSIVKRDRAQLMWGPMIDSLRKRKKPPPAPLLDNLDNIRRSFRNPTQHPEKIYDINEVQDLFGLCIDVVNRMLTLLK